MLLSIICQLVNMLSYIQIIQADFVYTIDIYQLVSIFNADNFPFFQFKASPMPPLFYPVECPRDLQPYHLKGNQPASHLYSLQTLSV